MLSVKANDMASVVANDETTNNYNNSDDTDDLTKLGKRAQTDYTKFDNVEDVPGYLVTVCVVYSILAPLDGCELEI